jgi:pyruvate/2-oxoglutarate dehydrogenase complex dihydrolipoamide acyltransferase (E2) component
VAEITFALPDLGEGLQEATVLEWLVTEGEFVERNAPLVEVETTKSAVELPSPQSGVIARFHVEEGTTLGVGAPLITFTVNDDQAGIVGTVPVEETPARRVRLQLPED